MIIQQFGIDCTGTHFDYRTSFIVIDDGNTYIYRKSYDQNEVQYSKFKLSIPISTSRLKNIEFILEVE